MASGSTGDDLSGDKYKISLIGDYGVGKTSILLWLVDGNDGIFTFGQPALKRDYLKYNLKVDDKMAELSIWDTCESETIRSSDYYYTLPHYRGVAGIMIVYDSTDRESFSNVHYWLSNIQQHADANVVIMLIGNKCDLKSKQEIPQHYQQDLVSRHGMLFKQTSALDGTNIQAAFEDLVREIRQRDVRRRCTDTITLSKENKSSCY